ncbi:hypothetical protein BCR42DRAFT_225899 [Absidia repens]|uniref:Glutamine amidotransferase type-2 domain-containing protein n=1 Tax=Absidia repens TaxID=90262 RepID=A0A1X2IPE7_9FUNG|nr:hypothetical protein BCR42DRAFT_225899 [Absidia repens]
MCGFTVYLHTGTISQNGDIETPALDLDGALHLIRHRGPDSQGIYISPDGRCGLGHARLSIIDLEGGQQPLSNIHNNIHAVVNGELYDHDRLMLELKAKGHQFKTQSDSELALHYYEDYDTDFVEQLRGEFAVAIWDERKGRLTVARDRFGIKPVYYTVINGTFMAASEIKAFLALGWKPEWDVSSIVHDGAATDFRTCFKDVYKLPPAHYMTVSSSGSIQVKQYWEAEYANKYVEDTRSVEEMVLGVRERLLEAVRLRLRADVPLGVYLSGGIDSSCIAGVVADLLRKENPDAVLNTYCISFTGGEKFDEGEIAERTAEFCGAKFHKIPVTNQDMIDNFADAIWHIEQPLFNLNGVGKYILSKHARESGITVTLTGEGSDEHFIGYEFFHTDYLREADNSTPNGFGRPTEETRLRQLNERLENNLMMSHKMDKSVDTPSSRRWNNIVMQDHFGALLSSPAEMYQDDVIKRHGIPDSGSAMLEATSAIARSKARKYWHPVHASLFLENHTFLPNILLNSLGDRSEMAHSIEARTPFLDHHLCEYVNSLPPSVKLRGDGEEFNEKWILKEAMKPYITEEIYKRTKHPFMPPPNKPDKAPPALKLMNELLTKEKVDQLGWANWAFIESQRERFLENTDQTAFKNLLVIMSYIIIGEKFGVAPAVA